MAKISIEFDTVTKEMSASMDGKAVANAVGVEIYPSWDDKDEYRCIVTSRSKDEANDLVSIQQIIASETVAGKDAVVKAKASESVEFPGFVVTVKQTIGKAIADIQNFFARK